MIINHRGHRDPRDVISLCPLRALWLFSYQKIIKSLLLLSICPYLVTCNICSPSTFSLPYPRHNWFRTEFYDATPSVLSLIHISEPTRLGMISYAVFCL